MGQAFSTLLIFLTVSLILRRTLATDFRIQSHLSTKTLYENSPPVSEGVHQDKLPDPQGCTPQHSYLISRHGARWPTAQTLKAITGLSDLFQAAGRKDASAEWAQFLEMAGEIHPLGEEELRLFGARFRQRFPTLFDSPYYPAFFGINSTQVPRTSASAMAFAQGAFPCDNPEVPEAAPVCKNPQPVSITMQPSASDHALRFFESCGAYKAHKTDIRAKMAPWLKSLRHSIADEVSQRLGASADHAQVEALWKLCVAETSLFSTVNGTCSIFTSENVALLEYADDISFLETAGYGSCLNYRIAGPLLGLAALSLKAASLDEGSPATLKTALIFAHAETIAPLASLLGFFGSPGGNCTVADMNKARSRLSQYSPPFDPPPATRPWNAATVSPFMSNIGFTLYRCTAKGQPGTEDEALQQSEEPLHIPGSDVDQSSDVASPTFLDHTTFLVRTTYNEYVIRLPGCSEQDGHDCPLDDFLANVVGDLGDAAQFHDTCAQKLTEDVM